MCSLIISGIASHERDLYRLYSYLYFPFPKPEVITDRCIPKSTSSGKKKKKLQIIFILSSSSVFKTHTHINLVYQDYAAKILLIFLRKRNKDAWEMLKRLTAHLAHQ